MLVQVAHAALGIVGEVWNGHDVSFAPQFLGDRFPCIWAH